MIIKQISDLLDVAESGYKSVGATAPLVRDNKWIGKLVQLADTRDIPAAELGMAIHYYEVDASLADLPSNVAYLVGALEMFKVCILPLVS